MRRRKTALMSVLAATATTAALLTGCSSGETGGKLPDAGEALSAAAASTAELTSAHLDIAVDGKIEGLPVKKLSGDLTNVPATAAEGSASIELAGSVVEVEFVVVDGVLYGSMDNGKSFSDFGEAAKLYDPSTILNPDTGLANVLKNFDDATAEGAETINGVDTVRITGKVSAEAANLLLPDLEATEPVDSVAWISRDEQNNLVQARLSPGEGTRLDVTLSEWNTPVTITKPAL